MSAAAPVSEVMLQRPSARLAPDIQRYLGYRSKGFPPGLHRGLPSRNLTFIISLDRTVQMQLAPGQDQPVSGPVFGMQAFVGGLQTWPAHIFHDGDQEGIAVDLTPLGASAVLGVPGGELAGQVVALDSSLGRRGRDLTERLLNTDGWPARFRVLDDALARAVGWSRRHLTEQVRRQIGLPPRQFVRILRFERSCALLRLPQAGQRTMTDLAMASGYFDHTHMLHEWQRLAGCTPTAWRHEELPPVQDDLGRRAHPDSTSSTPASNPTPTPSSTLPPLTRTIWPCVNYHDAHAALAFLADAFGFVPTIVVDGGPARAVAHAEMRWPEGGGIMLGSAVSDGATFEQRPTGAVSVYVVTEQPDALFARATAAGATVMRGLEDTDYGARGFTVSDPEGNLWSFGTYLGP